MNPTKRFTTREVLKCLGKYEKCIYDLVAFDIGHFSGAMLKKQEYDGVGKNGQFISRNSGRGIAQGLSCGVYQNK